MHSYMYIMCKTSVNYYINSFNWYMIFFNGYIVFQIHRCVMFKKKSNYVMHFKILYFFPYLETNKILTMQYVHFPWQCLVYLLRLTHCEINGLMLNFNKDESKTHQCIDMPLKHKMSAQNPPPTLYSLQYGWGLCGIS